jgi:hypothetical protein
MTTEVQIRKNRTYLPHLRRVVACLASTMGMSCKEAEATEEAVTEVCTSSIEASNGSADGSLSIRLDAHDNCMTVEICDPSCSYTPCETGQWLVGATSAGTFQKIRRLADEVEFMPAGEGTTIRLTKYARETGRTPVSTLDQLPTSTLQA